MTHPTGTGSPAVELEGIARRFRRAWVLRGLSLRIEPGEAVAVTGANGSGKTTLLRIVATALRPTRGRGSVFGHDLLRETDRVRARVGYLGHSPGVYPDLTAAENLRFVQKMLTGRSNARAASAALEAVGLARRADDRARDFSAGMLRRLGLARLTLQDASLVLLDEPHASLDRDGADYVDSWLERHLARGGSVLVATHDAERLSPILTRVVRLEQGLVREEPPIDPARPEEVPILYDRSARGIA